MSHSKIDSYTLDGDIIREEDQIEKEDTYDMEKSYVDSKTGKKRNVLFDVLIGEALDKKQRHIYEENDEFLMKKFKSNLFIINWHYSMFADTVLLANYMNIYSTLSAKMVYNFYYYVLGKKNSRGYWQKKNKIENIDIIKKYYYCSDQRALSYLNLLKEDDIQKIKEYLNE